MPLLPLDRLPLPSLRTYTIISVLLLICSIVYIYQTALKDENGGLDTNLALFHLLRISNDSSYSENIFRDRIFLFAYTLFKEPFCLIVIINMAYCCLILFGRLLQKLVFNQLRVIEQQHLKDKFWNFVFYKFIFIFGVMNAQELEEIILWSAWFSVLGFLHIMTLLCRDRFEYFASSPTVSVSSHVKLIILLLWVQLISFFLFAVSLFAWLQYVSINTFAFMAAECLLLILKTLFVLIKSGIHLWDISGNEMWESRMIYSYYVEFFFEVSALFVDFVHHVHMLCWGNIFLSMASLIICMQLRYLFYELQRRLKRHKNYRNVVNSMQAQLPMAAPEELQISDECAICWEKMESARKLPCNHLFHNACLRSWLEQDTSCPICRLSLGEIASSHRQINLQQIGQGPMHPPRVPPIAENIINDNSTTRMTNHFHFDGSRYVSWLPSFSVEVTHMHLLGQQRQQNVQTSLYDNMARQVLEVFPDFSMDSILEDLRVTRSIETTIENIIEGLIMPISVNNTFASAPPTVAPTAIAPYAEPTTSDNPTATVNKIQENVDELQGEGAQMVGSGGRFSKSPAERESMLALRKKDLIEKAKRRYLTKNATLSLRNKEFTKSYDFQERVGSSVDEMRHRRQN